MISWYRSPPSQSPPFVAAMSAEQIHGQLAQEQQLQPMQWQHQAGQQNPAVSPPGLGPPVRARNLLDTRFVKIPFIPGEGKDHEDWATNRTICEILEICDEELAEQFDEEDVQGHAAEIYDVLRGEALQLVRMVDDMERFRAWSKLYRMVGQVTNPPKGKELRDVERELMKWEEKAKALTKEFGETFKDTVKVGIVISIMPSGRPGTRVPVGRRQAGQRRCDGQDPVRLAQ